MIQEKMVQQRLVGKLQCHIHGIYKQNMSKDHSRKIFDLHTIHDLLVQQFTCKLFNTFFSHFRKIPIFWCDSVVYFQFIMSRMTNHSKFRFKYDFLLVTYVVIIQSLSKLIIPSSHDAINRDAWYLEQLAGTNVSEFWRQRLETCLYPMDHHIYDLILQRKNLYLKTLTS